MSTRVNFKYEDGSKIFFTSDLHFNHENILKFCKRPFKDVQEMNEALIENYNNKVPEDGIVFNLGDFAWGGFKPYKDVLERLNGKTIFIRGNHDRKNGPQTEEQYNRLFEFSSHQMLIEIEGRKVYLNHFPFLCYSGTFRDKNALVYQLHGHVHLSNVRHRNTGRDCERCFNMLFPTQYDVGVDFNDFTPISWHELDARIKEQIERNDNLKIWVED